VTTERIGDRFSVEVFVELLRIGTCFYPRGSRRRLWEPVSGIFGVCLWRCLHTCARKADLRSRAWVWPSGRMARRRLARLKLLLRRTTQIRVATSRLRIERITSTSRLLRCKSSGSGPSLIIGLTLTILRDWILFTPRKVVSIRFQGRPEFLSREVVVFM